MAKLLNSTNFNIDVNKLRHKTTRSERTFRNCVVEKVYFDYEKIKDKEGKEINIQPGTIEAIPLASATRLFAKPLDESLNNLPLKGESVDIIMISANYFYRRKNNTETINNANSNSAYKGGAGSNPIPTAGLQNFKSPVVSTNSTSTTNNGLENSFKKENIHRLKLHNGDTIIQSRFGQSMRLSAYNNSFGQPNPTLIIRNGESPLNLNKKGVVTVEEDINRDGSTIAMSSGKYKSQFVPGSVDKNGKSDFKLKTWQNNPKYGLEDYPKELDGNQIIISSQRLIFSSRSKETFFFSKGWFGITSDSGFSVDSNGGVNIVSHKNNIDIEAKEQKININVGKSGVINLGSSKELSPIVDGKGLTDLLQDLIDITNNICRGGLLTPAGISTGENPLLAKQLQTLRSKVPGLLSKTVFAARK